MPTERKRKKNEVNNLQRCKLFTREEIKLAPKVIESIKKIAKGQGKKWEWEPERGNWFLGENNQLFLVTDIWKNFIFDDPYCYEGGFNEVIPLLHWEKLEKILEETTGYFLEVEKIGCENCECLVLKGTGDPETGCVAVGKGKTRQEAVMRAIVKLSEKIDNRGG